jgi:hypothetical protein
MAPPQAPVAPAATQPRVAPGALGPLNRPTERPQEPLTAGAPFGPGNTPQGMQYMGAPNSDPVLDEMRALYAQFPSEDLANMLDSYLREGY